MSRWADWKGIGSYGTVGLEMVLSVMFGLFVGRWLGEKAGSATWGALIGFGFGVAAAVRALLSAFQNMQRQTAADGFRESATDRSARFEIDERRKERRGALDLADDAPQQRDSSPESDDADSSPGRASEPGAESAADEGGEAGGARSSGSERPKRPEESP